VLHSRVLVEFFRSKPKQDDVVVSHYVAGWRSDDDLNAMVGSLKSMNKRWRHPSVYRLDIESREHEIEDWIQNAFRIRKTWDRFMYGMSEDKCAWFEAVLGDPMNKDLRIMGHCVVDDTSHNQLPFAVVSRVLMWPWPLIRA